MSKERFAGTCPVCLRVQMLTAGSRMVLHGYQRPGSGFILGQCPGVNYPAWEISPEGAIHYGGLLERRVDGLAGRLQALLDGQVKNLTIKRYPTLMERREHRLRAGEMLEETIGPEYAGWARALEATIHQTESDLRWTRREYEQVRKRVNEWQPGRVRPVAEIEARERAEKVATLSWDPKEAMWIAKSSSGRTVETAHTVADVVRFLGGKGWHVGDDVPDEIPMSRYIAQIAQQPIPKKKKIPITSKLDPVTAGALIVVYQMLSDEMKREFDITGTKRLAEEAGRATPWEFSNAAFHIQMDELFRELTRLFTGRIEARAKQSRR